MEAVVMSWNPKEPQSPGMYTQLLTLLYESSVNIWVIVMKQNLGKLKECPIPWEMSISHK